MDQQYRLKIQKVLYYDELPENFKGELRWNRSLSGEVWLQDESFQMLTLSQISKKATVMIVFQHGHIVPEDALRITEIIYKNNSY